jgi:hypothetical protein
MPDSSSPQSCTLNRTWVLKMSIFTLILVGFGFWALFDASILYPARGLEYASLKLRDFLQKADEAHLLRADKLAMPDPAAELARLEPKINDLRSLAQRDGSEARTAAMDAARYDYLTALDIVWKLGPGETILGEPDPQIGAQSGTRRSLRYDIAKAEGIDIISQPGQPARRETLDPQKLLAELSAYWKSHTQPVGLSAWDLRMQWAFVVIGFGGGIFLLALLLRCRAQARRITFNESDQRLTLASGATMVPSDLRDIDKRLWHKYYCTLVTESGQEHKIDLLRYVPLEQWVLAMERTRFPDRAEDQDKPDEPAPEPAATTSADEPTTPQ